MIEMESEDDVMKHIVFFKLKERTSENQNKVAEILQKMTPENCPMVDSLKVGIDFLNSDRSFDLVLEVVLPKEELSHYANYDFHCAVKKEFAPYVEKSVTVDVE